jgi:uncharacterized protein (DUF58 family)
VPWLFLLAAWLLVLVIAAAGYAAWSRTGLRMHLAVESTRPAPGSPAEQLPEYVLRRSPVAVPVFEGDGLELEVGLDNSGGARGPAWVGGDVAGKHVMFATGVVPRSGWRRLKVLGEVPRGPIDSTGWAIGTGDPFGFFAARRRCPDNEVALVFPRFMSFAGRWEAREVESAVAAPRAGSGNELFGIREYRPGDSLRRIHWRSSARHGELVVREYEPPGVRTLRIVVDPAPPTDDVADQIARIAASEAWECVKDGGRVVLSGPGLEPTRPERDVWLLLEWLARYPGPSGPSGHLPMNGEDVVIVTADPDLIGPARRAWIVGDAAVAADVPFERVGTTWPL